MNDAQRINQDSGDYEWYTPKFIIEACREVMGSIDLDPASSEKANEIVKAREYYDHKDNGLTKSWEGNVFMNHPFSRKNNPVWINKLLMEAMYYNRTRQACCITYASTSEKWFKELYNHHICFLSPRTNYYLPDGTKKRGVTKGSCVTYIGQNDNKFIEKFKEYGRIMKPA